MFRQNLQYLIPVIGPQGRRFFGIVRCSEQNPNPPKFFEMTRAVVDQNIRIDDVFVSAEYDPCWRDEREVFFQPFELGVEGGWDIHGGAGDENIVIL